MAIIIMETAVEMLLAMVIIIEVLPWPFFIYPGQTEPSFLFTTELVNL